MFIKKLSLLNFQVIKEFNADFNGDVYLITGDNELGKSTILKAIGALLTGERDEVLRNGEDKGFAKMVVGGDGKEYEVSLSFTKANPRGTLVIKSEGMQTNNVSALQSIFGYHDFDAVEFSRWSETAEGRRKQIAVVKSLLPDAVKDRIEAIDANVMALRQERQGINRDVKTLGAIATEARKGMTDADLVKFSKQIDVADLVKEQSERAQMDAKAQTVRASLEQRTQQLAGIEGRIKQATDTMEACINEAREMAEQAKKAYEDAVRVAREIEQNGKTIYEQELAAIEADREDFTTRAANCNKWLKTYEEKVKARKDINAQIADANEHNRKALIVSDYKEKSAKLNEATAKVDEIESRLTALAAEREQLINDAKLPVEGLTFGEDGLELNGTPFAAGHTSDSQIMEVATKLIIASNPTVKVFRIARGESLGAKRLQAIVDMAKANGFQGFIEQVQRGQDEMTIHEYIEGK